MTDDLGHDIANSNSFRVASERCPDHFSYERCTERYHLTPTRSIVLTLPDDAGEATSQDTLD